MGKIVNINAPFRRVYVDLASDAHAELVRLAKEAGTTQRAYLAHLIVNATKGKKRK